METKDHESIKREGEAEPADVTPVLLDPPNPFPKGGHVRLTLAERMKRVDPTIAQRYQQRSGE